jgi:RimJ/RimL family protein N-acetyltransferase
MWTTLNNGTKVHFKKIEQIDAESRHDFFVKLSMAQAGILHTIDEIEIHAHETYDKINDFLKNKRGLWLLALTLENKIVGEVDITIKNLARIRHNGFLTIGVLPEFQGIGLGTKLMEYALLWAREHHLLRIELTVFKGNIKAQNLYKKFGFVVEGIRKNYIRHEDGRFEDDLVMGLCLAK